MPFKRTTSNSDVGIRGLTPARPNRVIVPRERPGPDLPGIRWTDSAPSPVAAAEAGLRARHPEPVVFSHGWPLSADVWEDQMLFRGARGYRVIAHDRRGTAGRASPGTATTWTPTPTIWPPSSTPSI